MTEPLEERRLTLDREPLAAAARLPGIATRLGCSFCGLPEHEHGSHLIHRFVRPHLPPGYRYLDQVSVGDAIVLSRELDGGRRLVVEALEERPASEGLLCLRSARSDCFLLAPGTIVRTSR